MSVSDEVLCYVVVVHLVTGSPRTVPLFQLYSLYQGRRKFQEILGEGGGRALWQYWLWSFQEGIQNNKGFWLKINSSQGSAAASGWAGWALAHPEFGSSVNPITTRGADYAHHITASPPKFENLAASLIHKNSNNT